MNYQLWHRLLQSCTNTHTHIKFLGNSFEYTVKLSMRDAKLHNNNGCYMKSVCFNLDAQIRIKWVNTLHTVTYRGDACKSILICSNVHIFSPPHLTFQAEPNVLPFDLGDCCHMNVLRWQRVDSLQFHGLFEDVVTLLLAGKQREGENRKCFHSGGCCLLCDFLKVSLLIVSIPLWDEPCELAVWCPKVDFSYSNC